MTFFDFVKRQDLFAIPVQMTYKGERGFSSFIGGCCSIVFVLIVMALFGVYTHDFYMNPQFSSSASVSYITYDENTLPYYLPAKRSTMAINLGSNSLIIEEYLRVRFIQWNAGLQEIQAVYCRDFFAEEIAAEAEYEQTYGYDPSKMWYTRTFSTNWICPDTTDLQLQAFQSFI